MHDKTPTLGDTVKERIFTEKQNSRKEIPAATEQKNTISQREPEARKMTFSEFVRQVCVQIYPHNMITLGNKTCFIACAQRNPKLNKIT